MHAKKQTSTQYLGTVPPDPPSRKIRPTSNLWNVSASWKLPHPHPLLKSIKQSINRWESSWWKYKLHVYVDLHICAFKFFILSTLTTCSKPPGGQEHNIPHLKGLISANWNSRAQRHDSTFTLCHDLWKMVILLLKIAYRPKLWA